MFMASIKDKEGMSDGLHVKEMEKICALNSFRIRSPHIWQVHQLTDQPKVLFQLCSAGINIVQLDGQQRSSRNVHDLFDYTRFKPSSEAPQWNCVCPAHATASLIDRSSHPLEPVHDPS